MGPPLSARREGEPNGAIALNIFPPHLEKESAGWIRHSAQRMMPRWNGVGRSSWQGSTRTESPCCPVERYDTCVSKQYTLGVAPLLPATGVMFSVSPETISPCVSSVPP